VSHALAATPRGKAVAVTAQMGDLQTGPRIIVDDGGASLPVAARRAFLALELEPGTYGRPTSLGLYLCQVLATCQGASFALDDSPLGGLRVTVTFPR
jgi:hypothetical protein